MEQTRPGASGADGTHAGDRHGNAEGATGEADARRHLHLARSGRRHRRQAGSVRMGKRTAQMLYPGLPAWSDPIRTPLYERYQHKRWIHGHKKSPVAFGRELLERAALMMHPRNVLEYNRIAEKVALRISSRPSYTFKHLAVHAPWWVRIDTRDRDALESSLVRALEKKYEIHDRLERFRQRAREREEIRKGTCHRCGQYSPPLIRVGDTRSFYDAFPHWRFKKNDDVIEIAEIHVCMKCIKSISRRLRKVVELNEARKQARILDKTLKQQKEMMR